MEQIYKGSNNPALVKRSFAQERQARINRDPFDVPEKPSRESSGPVMGGLMNLVKGKVAGVVSTFKKLLNSTSLAPNEIVFVSNSHELPKISDESVNRISSAIQSVVSKSEYQDNYKVDSNRGSTQKKTPLLEVMGFYKGMADGKANEKTEANDDLVMPGVNKLQAKPGPSNKMDRLSNKRTDSARKYKKQSVDNQISNTRGASLNEKRKIHNNLEKSSKEKKKVTFVSEFRRSGSIIRYVSSDDEESSEESINKKVFTQEEAIVRKNEPIKIVLKKKIKINPFQKKYIEERVAKCQSLLAGKGVKYTDNYDGKYNRDDSVGSDGLLNDSKLETDSEESNSVISNYEPRTFNILKNNNDNQDDRSDVMSQSSHKSSRSSKGFLYKGLTKITSPVMKPMKPFEIQEQDNEKEESEAGEPEEEKECAVAQTQDSINPGFESNIVHSQEPTQESFFDSQPVQPLETQNVSVLAASTEKQNDASLFKPMEEKPQKNENPMLFSFQKASSSNISIPQDKPAVSNPILAEVVSSKPVEPQVTEQPAEVKQNLTTVETKPEVPAPQPTIARSGSIVPEDALKNPVFASLSKSLSTPVTVTNNPFLNKSSTIPSFTNLISGNNNNDSFIKPQPVGEKAQESQNGMQNTNTGTSTFSQIPKSQSVGILELLGSKSSPPSTSQGLSFGTSELKPTGSFSWLNQNNSQQSTQTNLFGNSLNNNTTQFSLGQPAQPQSNLFGNNLSNNSSFTFGSSGGMSTESSGMGSMFGSNTGGLGNISGGLGNNTNSGGMLGGGLFQNNSNTGGSMFGFGASQSSNNAGGLFSSGGMAPANNSNNPFLATSSQQSSSSGLFGQESSGGSSINRSYSIGGSGKKNQKQRAF